MNILHVAPINVAGVPYNMMEMQRSFGHHARLVTLHRNDLSFPEDLCLNIPLYRNPLAMAWRNKKARETAKQPRPPILRPKNGIERAFFKFDDWMRASTVHEAISKHRLDEFSIIHYDGGLDFFRDARMALEWKKQGKHIVCHYMGSDLRIRGVHPILNEISDLNITNESDHLHYLPNIHYIYIPFDTSHIVVRTSENTKLRIVHSPSKRMTKGTEIILEVIGKLRKIRDIDFVLIEDTPHDEVLRIKETCDIAIEQVGNMGGTGYGRNSLETLAMGIPTVTEMTADYIEWIPENPFVLADAATLLDRLVELIDSESLRKEKSANGRRWVERHHSYESVHSRLMQLYSDYGII